MPQKPYCCTGTLRDQLLYPYAASDKGEDNGIDQQQQQQHAEDAALLDILRSVDLADLPQRVATLDCPNGLDAIMDWSNILSLGEQQRLAFGRVLYRRPRCIIMDESTSALDVESEALMYRLLAQQRNPYSVGSSSRVTYVSVGHRPSLLAHHDTKLCLTREGPSLVERVMAPPLQSSLAADVCRTGYAANR